MISEDNSSFSESKGAPASAYLGLISGLLVITFSPILLRMAEAPGPVSGFYRMAICWLVLTPWFIKRLRENNYTFAGLRPAILAGLFFGGDLIQWTTGVMLAGPTIPTLFGNTTPLWVGLGALLLFKEKLKPSFWVGLALAFTGAVLIAGTGDSQNEHLLEGVLLGLGAGIFYGGFFLAAQRGRERVDPLSFLWVVSFVSSLVLLLTAAVLGQPLTGYSLNTVLIFLAMGVVIQVAGWWLISYAQGLLPASVISPTLLGQPVLTGVLAVPLLGEILSPTEIFGGIIVIIGIYLVHRSKQPGKDE
jgi:drug/metabolite transporter (DMT)-like permease